MAANLPAQPVAPSIIGWILALLVLIGAAVLWLVGQMEPRDAIMFIGLALARLL